MKLVLDLRKSLEENAKDYFEKAKRSRKKASGAREAIARLRERAPRAEPQREITDELPQRRRREWYEKFRWCVSSQGLLLIGGRDATTNELVIKKHAEQGDRVLHTDMAGSPFVVVKAEGRPIEERTLEEAAQMTAIYSRAWRQGLGSLEVFHVAPDQVSKQTRAGESIGRGAFMIHGKTTYLHPRIECAVGVREGRVMAGPIAAVRAQCDEVVLLRPGRMKSSDAAKLIRARIGGELDEIVAALPAGGVEVVDERRAKTKTI